METKEYTIWSDGPKSRCMDRTPNTLAKELGLTTNTIKKRLEPMGDCFDLPGKDPLNKRRPYQVYSYESLPILIAYLKRNIYPKNTTDTKRRFTENSINDMKSFMQGLEDYLAEHTEQTFCQEFLYSEKAFQDYFMESHIQKLITDRLHCIELLSRRINVEPTCKPDCASSYVPGYLHFSSVLQEVVKRLN